MKKLISLLMLPAVVLTPTAALADYSQGGGVRQTRCFKTVYREEYVPGTRRNPGYVRRWKEKVKVPCRRGGHRGSHQQPHTHHTPRPVDNNSCIEGAVLGGIAGAGVGAALSRDEGMFIGIPLGIVGGSLVGCQIDGG